MFYSQFILAKKGPLGTIWIAAHLERKLRKNQVADTDIGVSVDSIIFPEVPIALRLSSHLLLGVVRIYSRKVSYLFDDCSEALLKIKQAFRSTAVDLPPEESKAPYHSITLPETFDLEDFELPDNDIIHGNYVDHHVSAREQITLQDPMDCIVFSTSKFGLDERFGDGDTSQIGLDLEEELLFEKGTTSGHGENLDASTVVKSDIEQSSLFKEANSVQEICESPLATGINSLNIQVPSTPGLVEEPNLPSAQDISVSDDHIYEDQNSTEFVEKELVGAASSQSEAYPMDLDSVLPPPKENEQHHDHHEFEITASKVPDHATGAAFELDDCNCIDSFHSKYDADDLSCLTSDHLSYNDKPSAEPGVLNSVKVDRSLWDSYSQIGNKDSPASPKPEHPGFHECISQSDSGQEKLLSASKPVHKSCSLHIDDANSHPQNMASIPCQPVYDVGISASETSEREDAPNISMATVAQEPMQQTVMSDQMKHPACFRSTGPYQSNFNGKNDCVMSIDSLSGKENIAAFPDLPPPEKLLSVPDADRTDVVLVDSTPAKEILAEGDGDSTVNILSGKKRSFTESTLTFVSITSVDSFAGPQSKKSAEFIPNDDDLLSSILVGRQSTILRIKPTPTVLDVDSMKRHRVTPRTTPYKRKVLLDDSMVLHGDTIRQQLIDTEDIRRLRKKTPCTLPEIWRLEKRLLEDEIFSEPLFSGMSAELISLHTQPFDLSGIRIVRDEEKVADFSEPNQIDSCTRAVYEEALITENNLESVARDVTCEQHAKEIINQENDKASLILDQNSLEYCLTLFDDKHKNLTSQHETSGRNAAIGNEDISIPVCEGADDSINLAKNLASVSSLSLGKGISTDGATVSSASWTKSIDQDVPMQNSTEVSVQTDDMLHSTDPELVTGTAYLAVQLNKNELEQRCTEVLLIKKVEGFESLAAVAGVGVDHSSSCNGTSALAAVSPESPVLAVSDHALSGSVENQCESASKDTFLAFNQRDNLVFDHHDSDLRLDYSTGHGDLDHDNTIFSLKENVRLPDVDPQFITHPATAFNQSIIEDHVQDFEADKIDHDTDFLNFDDDNDAAEDGDNTMPTPDEIGMQENVGWSARTRAVAVYLQVLFDKEALRGRGVVHLNNLLAGKSRKEASRMFFETLVLKTKDYIHVEQEDAFCNISIKPGQQLMKTELDS